MDIIDLFFKAFEKNNNLPQKYLIVFLLLSCVMLTKFEIDRENIRLKTCIMYIMLFIMAIFKIFSTTSILLILLIITFIFYEFVFADKFKRRTMRNPLHFILDYIYQILFEYKVLFFISSLFLLTSFFKKNLINIFKLLKIYPFLINNFNNLNKIYSTGILIIGIFILLIGITKIINNEFETSDFEEIFKKMEKIIPFAGFGPNQKLVDYANILTYKEDKSFFIRKNSYNWISISFILYRLKRLYINSKNFFLFDNTFIGNIFNRFITITYYMLKILEFILKTIRRLMQIIYNVLIKRKNLKEYLRGYSTIEMQLIRTLSVKSGYMRQYIQRKAYEFIYSKIFFECLKKNYRYYIYDNLEYYKYYLIYIYMRIAPVKINNIMYENILELYNKKRINDITPEEFFIWTYGLSFNEINYDMLHSKSINTFNINTTKLKKLIQKYMDKSKKEEIL